MKSAIATKSGHKISAKRRSFNCAVLPATAGKQMIGMLEGMKNMTILENPISIKSALAENQLGALEALADELAKQVNG